ncbi:hypothetical protein D3C86_1855260 [compost metagenome]
MLFHCTQSGVCCGTFRSQEYFYAFGQYGRRSNRLRTIGLKAGMRHTAYMP